jgi:cyanate permease
VGCRHATDQREDVSSPVPDARRTHEPQHEVPTYRPAMAAGRDGRWEALAIGSAIYLAFGLISTAIATVVTEVRADLGLSFTQMGVILGAWQLMYIVVAVPLGVAIDRVGLKRALLIGAATIAASALVRGLAVDFWTMLAAVALFGIGGPVVSIGLPKLVATWFPPGARALPTGVYITAVSLGSSLGLAGTQPVLVPLFGGWREVHLALAGVGALVTLWWAVRGRGRDTPASAPREAMATAFRLVVRSRPVLLISVVGLTGFLVTHGTSNWLPQLLEAKGYDPAASGLLAAIPRLAAVASGLAAAQLGPWAASMRRRSSRSSRRPSGSRRSSRSEAGYRWWSSSSWWGWRLRRSCR